jgi:hypothetical protein
MWIDFCRNTDGEVRAQRRSKIKTMTLKLEAAGVDGTKRFCGVSKREQNRRHIHQLASKDASTAST